MYDARQWCQRCATCWEVMIHKIKAQWRPILVDINYLIVVKVSEIISVVPVRTERPNFQLELKNRGDFIDNMCDFKASILFFCILTELILNFPTSCLRCRTAWFKFVVISVNISEISFYKEQMDKHTYILQQQKTKQQLQQQQQKTQQQQNKYDETISSFSFRQNRARVTHFGKEKRVSTSPFIAWKRQIIESLAVLNVSLKGTFVCLFTFYKENIS